MFVLNRGKKYYGLTENKTYGWIDDINQAQIFKRRGNAENAKKTIYRMFDLGICLSKTPPPRPRIKICEVEYI